MEREKGIASKAVFAAVMLMVAFSVFLNILIIFQALLEPVKVIRRADDNGPVGEMDAVIPRLTDGENIAQGDLVVFRDPRSEDAYAAYRVDGFQVDDRGVDYAVVGEENGQRLVPLRDAVGKVWLILPGGGLLLDFLRTPRGFALCVVSPWVLLVLYLVGNALKARRKLSPQT